MKTKTYLFLISVLFTAVLMSQNPTYQWAFNCADQIASSAEDASGNVYITGSFSGLRDFDPGPGTYTVSPTAGEWGFIAKYDPSGSFIWVSVITNTYSAGSIKPMKIKLDASGNIYICGSNNFQNSDFDPGPGVVNLPNGGNTTNGDGFIVKYDNSGNFLWGQSTYQSSSINSSELMGDIIIDDVNNIVRVGGNTSNSAYSQTFYYASTSGCSISIPAGFTYRTYGFILAYNMTTGAGLPSKTMSSGGSSWPVLTTDNAGAFYYAGVDAFTTTKNEAISKVNSATGANIWSVSLQNPYTLMPNDIALDNSGNVYVYGTFSQTMDFDPSPTYSLVTSVSNSDDIYLLKLDNSGNFTWVGTFGTPLMERAFSMDIVKPTGQIYVTGDFADGGSGTGTMDIDFGAGVVNLTDVSQGYDSFLIKYDINRNYLWSTSFANTYSPNNTLIYSEINIPPSNNIYISGQNFGGPFDLDFSSSTNNLTGTGGVISKYASCSGSPAQPLSITGNTLMCAGTSQLYSTTPASGASFYAWSLPGGWTGTSSTNTISVITGTTGGNVSVSAGNACGASAAQNLTVTINNVPATPAGINGLNSFCDGTSSCSYSVTIDPNTSSYNWSLPVGWSGSSSSNTIVASPGPNSGTISVTANNPCGASAAQTLAVTVNPLPTITVNSGAICAGDSFTMTPGGASTYTFSSGSNIVSPASTTSYSVTGTDFNGCTSPVAAVSAITVNALPTLSISTSNTLLCTGQSSTLTAGGATTYTWSTSMNGSNISISPTITTTYSVNGTDANGCMNSIAFTQSVSACTSVAERQLTGSVFTVYPNPTTGQLTIITTGEHQSLSVYNSLGELIVCNKLVSTSYELNLSEQPDGVYFVKVGSAIKKIIKH